MKIKQSKETNDGLKEWQWFILKKSVVLIAGGVIMFIGTYLDNAKHGFFLMILGIIIFIGAFLINS